jgi:hypothetical protein
VLWQTSEQGSENQPERAWRPVSAARTGASARRRMRPTSVSELAQQKAKASGPKETHGTIAGSPAIVTSLSFAVAVFEIST